MRADREGRRVTDLPIERVLFTEEQVEARVREVAAEISLRYQGRDLKLIGVLKGPIFFLTALARHTVFQQRSTCSRFPVLPIKKRSPGVVRISKDLDDSMKAKTSF